MKLKLLGVVIMAAVAAVAGASPAAGAPIQEKFDAIMQEVPDDHFFPKSMMRDLLKKYDDQELTLIHADFCALRSTHFEGKRQEKVYTVTAGGPAAGKSTLLETLQKDDEVYVDPDRSCLLHMEKTYKADKRSPADAYTHWREASNFLSNVYLAIALKEGYAISHGSTMATPHAKGALRAISQKYHYKVTVVHVTAPDEVRRASEKARQDGGVVQVTEGDFVEKQATFLTLLRDYADASDTLELYYRGEMGDATRAATIKGGELTIHSQKALDGVQLLHDQTLWQEVISPLV